MLQTNAAGDSIHVIDPAGNEIVGLIDGIEVPHGIVIAPDGKRIYGIPIDGASTSAAAPAAASPAPPPAAPRVFHAISVP